MTAHHLNFWSMSGRKLTQRIDLGDEHQMMPEVDRRTTRRRHDIFYPDGVGAWLARFDADAASGGMSADERFFAHGDAFRGCGSIRPGCRAETLPATRTASLGNSSRTTVQAGCR